MIRHQLERTTEWIQENNWRKPPEYCCKSLGDRFFKEPHGRFSHDPHTRWQFWGPRRRTSPTQPKMSYKNTPWWCFWELSRVGVIGLWATWVIVLKWKTHMDDSYRPKRCQGEIFHVFLTWGLGLGMVLEPAPTIAGKKIHCWLLSRAFYIINC